MLVKSVGRQNRGVDSWIVRLLDQLSVPEVIHIILLFSHSLVALHLLDFLRIVCT